MNIQVLDREKNSLTFAETNTNKPLDILLIYPGTKTDFPRTPFSIMTLASWIRKHGYSVKLMDERVEEIDWDLIGAAKLIGISSMTGPQLAAAVPLARTIKAREPDTPLIWGGPHVSFFPEQSCQSDVVDYVVEAEGEPVIIELMKKLLAGEEPKNVAGVTYKNQQGEIISYPKPPQIDLDLLDLPAYDMIDMKKYNDLSNGLSYESSRGCPYPCRFCYVYTFHDRKFRGKSPQKVLDEVKYLKNKYGIKKIYFTEDYLWTQKKRALEQFQLFIDNDLNITWEGFCRADFLSKVSDEEMEIIAKSGAEILTLGLESGSERMLKHIQKHITLDQAKAAIKKCVKHNIMTTSSFIIGMPTETDEDLEDTIRMYNTLTSYSDNIEINGFFLYAPYPGVPLYDEALGNGYKKMNSLEEWCQWNYSDASNNVWIEKKRLHRLQTLSILVRFKYLLHRFKYYSQKSPRYKEKKLNRLSLRIAFNLLVPFISRIADFRWKHRLFSWGYEWRLWRWFVAKRFNIN
ncbi:MAG: B12-binding domain-containing radical SAM protein [Nitrospinales bacterium]